MLVTPLGPRSRGARDCATHSHKSGSRAPLAPVDSSRALHPRVVVSRRPSARRRCAALVGDAAMPWKPPLPRRPARPPAPPPPGGRCPRPTAAAARPRRQRRAARPRHARPAPPWPAPCPTPVPRRPPTRAARAAAGGGGAPPHGGRPVARPPRVGVPPPPCRRVGPPPAVPGGRRGGHRALRHCRGCPDGPPAFLLLSFVHPRARPTRSPCSAPPRVRLPPRRRVWRA